MRLDGALKTTGHNKLLGAILFITILFNCTHVFGVTVPTGQNVTLAWNPGSVTNIVGYNIYYGVTSQVYPNKVNVGNVTNASISGLVAGVTYYFSATEYDSLGNESGYSNEISYSVPTGIPTVQITSGNSGQFVLTVSGLTGQTYNILATQDFSAWTVIGTVTLATGNSLNFTDTNAANFPQRFYRTQLQP